MKRTCLLALATAALLFSQRNAIDWPSFANDAQRTGWEKSDSSITKDNVKSFQLVMKMSLDPKLKGNHSLTSPVVLGRLISYRGFKELAFVESASGQIWSIDADMNRIFWEKTLEKPKHSPKERTAECAESVAGIPALTPPAAFGSRGRGGPSTPAANAKPSAGKSLLSATGFGVARPLFVLSSDGKLHLLNTSTGEDVDPPMEFLPNGARATALTALNGVVYTTTSNGCAGAKNAVWSLDLNGEKPTVHNFPAETGGIALGTDGTVYAQTPDSVVALAEPDLKLKGSFPFPAGLAAAMPVLFTYHEKEWMISAAKDGRLLILDPKTMSKLGESQPLGEIHGGLSSWQDADGARWVLAAVQSGTVAALKLDDSGQSPKLTEVWKSHALQSPETPVITSGIVFALASGQPDGHATLYAFDALTGNELYSTADQVTAPANLTGVTLANGRVFFTTTDGTLYAFGIALER